MSGRKSNIAEKVVINALRMVTGFLFWQHGAQKLFGMFGRAEPVEFFTLMGIAGVLETVGGILIFVGLFTRPTAFILAGEMAWAYFQSHAPGGFWPIMNRGELAVLFCFIFLYLAARGGGVFSLDALIRAMRGRRGARPAGAPAEAPDRPTPDEDVSDIDVDDFDPADLDVEELLRDDP